MKGPCMELEMKMKCCTWFTTDAIQGAQPCGCLGGHCPQFGALLPQQPGPDAPLKAVLQGGAHMH